MTGELGWAQVAGGRLPFEVAGTGTGVLLAHAGIADMRQWDPQWDAFAARHRVVRYDLRGFGGADTVETRFSNRDDQVAVLDAAGLERAVLVGCSRAGSISLDTTIEFPDRVAGLVWVCGGVEGFDGGDTPEELALFERCDALNEAKEWAALADLEAHIWVDGTRQPEGRAPAEVREFVRRMSYETNVAEKAYGDSIELDPPAHDRLTEIGVPVLVIQGLLDETGTVASAGVLASGVRHAKRLDLPDVAHMPSLERPEWFNAVVLEFLAQVA